jgi:WhiB family redox-sensing transcriptional regulator
MPGLGAEIFFPVGAIGAALDQTERAKAVCAGCSVREQCLEWALSAGQTDGVWGGMSEDERWAHRHGKRHSWDSGSRSGLPSRRSRTVSRNSTNSVGKAVSRLRPRSGSSR